MNQITKPVANAARYAVIRCFQPARIERELLAQVFDLVGRGKSDHFESSDYCQEPTGMAVNGDLKGGHAASFLSVNRHLPIAVMEDAA